MREISSGNCTTLLTIQKHNIIIFVNITVVFNRKKMCFLAKRC